MLLRDHPDYTAGYLHAGNVLLALGTRDEARATFERGIEACRRRGDGHAMSELEGALSSLDSGAPWNASAFAIFDRNASMIAFACLPAAVDVSVSSASA